MQRELKYILTEEQGSPLRQKQKTHKKARWNGRRVCVKFKKCFHFKTFLALDKILQGPAFDTVGRKPSTDYWILSFHWRANKKHWQTRNSRDVTMVQSEPCNSRRRKQRPDRPAERLQKLAKVQSLLRQYINSWETPPLTPHTHLTETMTDIFKGGNNNYNNNNNNYNNNNKLKRRDGTVKVVVSVVWGWPSMRWGGPSSARLSAAGIHLWCLHLPSPAVQVCLSHW